MTTRGVTQEHVKDMIDAEIAATIQGFRESFENLNRELSGLKFENSTLKNRLIDLERNQGVTSVNSSPGGASLSRNQFPEVKVSKSKPYSGLGPGVDGYDGPQQFLTIFNHFTGGMSKLQKAEIFGSYLGGSALEWFATYKTLNSGSDLLSQSSKPLDWDDVQADFLNHQLGPLWITELASKLHVLKQGKMSVSQYAEAYEMSNIYLKRGNDSEFPPHEESRRIFFFYEGLSEQVKLVLKEHRSSLKTIKDIVKMASLKGVAGPSLQAATQQHAKSAFAQDAYSEKEYAQGEPDVIYYDSTGVAYECSQGVLDNDDFHLQNEANMQYVQAAMAAEEMQRSRHKQQKKLDKAARVEKSLHR
jgi:Retrotransposon gag protein